MTVTITSTETVEIRQGRLPRRIGNNAPAVDNRPVIGHQTRTAYAVEGEVASVEKTTDRMIREWTITLATGETLPAISESLRMQLMVDWDPRDDQSIVGRQITGSWDHWSATDHVSSYSLAVK